jgi:hypothetical protein
MKDKLSMLFQKGTTPLLYALHFKQGKSIWPIESKKPNAIWLSKIEKEKYVFKPGYYVIVKRFSSKEEKRRIWASLISENDFNGMDLLCKIIQIYFIIIKRENIRKLLLDYI